MVKKLLFLLCLVIMTFRAGLSQSTRLPNWFDHDTTYHYFIGTSEPATGWNQPGFNDAGWLTGRYSIGYGDGDDSTEIGKTPSVYLRIPFEIVGKDQITMINYIVDFDDGFVAYLNGHEIARVNLGKWGESVAHDRLTDRSHEAKFYRYYENPQTGYWLCADTLEKYLAEGENIFAVQVHNDSVNGSDMSYKMALLDVTNAYYNFYWDEFRVIGQQQLESSPFPIVEINTDEYDIPMRHTRVKAHMGVINGASGRNRPGDPYTDYDGTISIEIRGKSSADFPKKSYGLETQDAAGENLNVPLMGMPAENDWILYGPFTDKSQIRNEIAFNIGRRMGRYQPRTRFCELIFNGENHGLYVLTEKIKRDSCRVNIAKLKPTDLTGDDLTGGFLFTLEYGNLGVRYPEDDDIATEQYLYIRDFYLNFIASIGSVDFLNPVTGYKKYIDTESLIDYIIVNEAIKNCDAYYLSDYAYKDRDDREGDGKMVYGPLWDNDLAFGNCMYQDGHLTTGWQFEINRYLQLTRIMRDTSFTHRLRDKWFTLRQSYLHTDSLLAMVDSLVSYIDEARIRNYQIWPVIDRSLFNQYGPFVSTNYGEEIQIMKNYMIARLDWVDNNISNIFYAMPSGLTDMAFENEYRVFPNPFSGSFTITMPSDEEGIYSIEMYDVTGRMILSEQHPARGMNSTEISIDNAVIRDLAEGIYMLILRKNGVVLFQQKVVKE